MSTSVFIVDDHAVVRDGLSALLAAHPDIRIAGAAGSAADAVHLASELSPEIILMDISLPDLSGIEAAHEILAIQPHARVIILSILGTSEHIYRALQAGVRGYLLKESAGREVVEAVLTVAAGGRYLSQPVLATLIDDYLSLHRQVLPKSPLELLSQREREILMMVLEGKSSAEIGRELFLSAKTVETYRSRMMHKLEVSDLAGLMKFAIQNGLVTLG